MNGKPGTKNANDMTAGIERLSDEDFLSRQEKLREQMAAQKLDGLLLTAGVDLKYFTDVTWRVTERPFGAVFSPHKDPVWICPGFELRRAQRLIRFGTDIRTWQEEESPYERVGQVMQDLGAAGGRLGIGAGVPSYITYAIERAAPGLSLVDGSPATEACRAIKSEKEIRLLDRVNQIHKTAFKEGIDSLHEGMTPAELAEIIIGAQEKFGAAPGRIGPVFGADASFPHAPTNPKHLEPGDVVIIDGGDCHIDELMADATRTVVFGTPTDKQRRVWDIVYRASQAAYDAVRPGVTCEELDRIARKIIEDAGFGPGYTYFTHRLGHGIGVQMHEYPYLVEGCTVALAPGMVFTNEPGIYIPGEFGVRIEDSFVVTEDGAKILGGMTSTAIDAPFGGKE